jgi:hypothetical protein
MSLQNILAICESVGIMDQRFVGQTISRNQRIVTSEYETVVPFAFEMKPMNYLLYSQSRAILNGLRIADKSLTQYLNFGDTGWENYIAYQGGFTSGQIEATEWQIASANKTLVLGGLPAISSSVVVVKVGDFCQVGNYSYIATETVLRGINDTVNIPVHRNLIETLDAPVGGVLGQYGTTISMGGDTYTGITFPVVLREYPTYTLVPMANDSYINWNGAFRAFEAVS